MTMETANSGKSLIEITKALSKFQGTITGVPKGNKNPFFNSRYADLDAVWDVVRKPLADNGLAVVQTTYEQGDKLYLLTTLLHISGECLTTYLPINPKANEPQAVGSALTYARRYSMSAILGVSADEDDDGEATTDHKPAAAKAKTTKDVPDETPHFCQEHKVPFVKHEKDGKKWYSHKFGDGPKDWCNEDKAAPKAPPNAPDAKPTAPTPPVASGHKLTTVEALKSAINEQGVTVEAAMAAWKKFYPALKKIEDIKNFDAAWDWLVKEKVVGTGENLI